jgi:hypothetical protein
MACHTQQKASEARSPKQKCHAKIDKEEEDSR